MLAPSVSYTTTKAYKSPESFIKTSLDTPSVTGGGAGAVVFKSITKTAGTGALKTALTLGAGAVGGALLFGGGGQKQEAEQTTASAQDLKTQLETQKRMDLAQDIIQRIERMKQSSQQTTRTTTTTTTTGATTTYGDIVGGGDIFLGGSFPTTPLILPSAYQEQQPSIDLSPVTRALATQQDLLNAIAQTQQTPTQTQEATKTTDWGMFALIGAGLLAVYMLFGRKKK